MRHATVNTLRPFHSQPCVKKAPASSWSTPVRPPLPGDREQDRTFRMVNGEFTVEITSEAGEPGRETRAWTG